MIIINQTVQEGGRVLISGLPLKTGSKVRITVEAEGAQPRKPYPTVQDWLDSDLLGMWKDRTDIGDSTEYVNGLRRQLEEPRFGDNDSD